MKDFDEFLDHITLISGITNQLEENSIKARINAKLTEQGEAEEDLIQDDTPVSEYYNFITKIKGPKTIDAGTITQNGLIGPSSNNEYYKSVTVNVTYDDDLGVSPVTFTDNGYYEVGENLGWNPVTADVRTVDNIEVEFGDIELKTGNIKNSDIIFGDIGLKVKEMPVKTDFIVMVDVRHAYELYNNQFCTAEEHPYNEDISGGNWVIYKN